MIWGCLILFVLDPTWRINADPRLFSFHRCLCKRIKIPPGPAVEGHGFSRAAKPFDTIHAPHGRHSELSSPIPCGRRGTSEKPSHSPSVASVTHFFLISPPRAHLRRRAPDYPIQNQSTPARFLVDGPCFNRIIYTSKNYLLDNASSLTI